MPASRRATPIPLHFFSMLRNSARIANVEGSKIPGLKQRPLSRATRLEGAPLHRRAKMTL